jgi:hypothetical protein
MLFRFLLLLIWISFSDSQAQSIQFHFGDSTVLPPKPVGMLHGVSGVEYVAKKDQWHLATDRGAYFVFDSIQNIRDFQKREKLSIPKVTAYWFESIRIDQESGTFYYAVENEYEPSWTNPDTTTYVAYFNGFPPRKAFPDYLVSPIPLPADNKGIEALAVSPEGNVWVAPEAGWAGETEVGQDTIHFLKFKKTLSGFQLDGAYAYQIDRSQCPHGRSETRGGISEIISLDEQRLLVLERCYDDGKLGSKIVKAKLWEVVVKGMRLEKEPTPAFDFNKQLPFIPDNLEAMAWWKPSPTGKRQLVLMSDDNPGLKNQQRTQVILLTEN